ncbi:hypothetical protein Trydic_g1174 [Trypoxylus dichotomus]
MVYAPKVILSEVQIEAAFVAYHVYVGSKLIYGIIFWGSIFYLQQKETCSKIFKKFNIPSLNWNIHIYSPGYPCCNSCILDAY